MENTMIVVSAGKKEKREKGKEGNFIQIGIKWLKTAAIMYAG